MPRRGKSGHPNSAGRSLRPRSTPKLDADTRAVAVADAVRAAIGNSTADPAHVYLAGRGEDAALVFYIVSRVPDLWAAGLALGGSPKPALGAGRVFARQLHEHAGAVDQRCAGRWRTRIAAEIRRHEPRMARRERASPSPSFSKSLANTHTAISHPLPIARLTRRNSQNAIGSSRRNSTPGSATMCCPIRGHRWLGRVARSRRLRL